MHTSIWKRMGKYQNFSGKMGLFRFCLSIQEKSGKWYWGAFIENQNRVISLTMENEPEATELLAKEKALVHLQNTINAQRMGTALTASQS